MGSCPVFELEITSDGQVKWFADEYNHIQNQPYSGHFRSQITPAQWKYLTDLLNYIDFAALQPEYFVMLSDSQSADLRITYANGRVKTIYDYALEGTYGIQLWHHTMCNLPKQLQWETQPDSVDFTP